MPIPTSEKDRDALKAAIAEITKSMLKMDNERTAMNDVIAAAASTYDIDKKLIRKIAKVMYQSNYSDVQEENEEFALLYESLVEGRVIQEKIDDTPWEND